MNEQQGQRAQPEPDEKDPVPRLAAQEQEVTEDAEERQRRPDEEPRLIVNSIFAGARTSMSKLLTSSTPLVCRDRRAGGGAASRTGSSTERRRPR